MAKGKSIILGAMMILILNGCASSHKEVQYIEKPIYVEVPVVQKVEIQPIRKPVYYIKRINKDSTPNEVVEAYVNTIKELNAYIVRLETAIEPLYAKTEK